LDALEQEAARHGVQLSEVQSARFSRYVSLIQAWSQRVNLVGNIDADVLVRRHLVESVALGAALREREILRPTTSVLDVGAGAGFPGVPIKIVWPSIALTLLEATAKKAAFLRALVDELELDGTSVLAGRAETFAHDAALRARFDLVLARAVAPLATLLELALPFARVGGRLVTPKGSRARQELDASANALSTLGGRAFVVPFDVPGPPQSIIAVVKQRPTDGAYPRRDGVPAKSPL
jgi:16S rRNA (guanine527-N7)-methyltransferase